MKCGMWGGSGALSYIPAARWSSADSSYLVKYGLLYSENMEQQLYVTYRQKKFIPVLSVVVCGYQANIMNVYNW